MSVVKNIVGHEKVVKALSTDLAPATLLMGPTGVGKRTICEAVASQVLHLPESETVQVPQVTVAVLRGVESRARIASTAGARAFIMDLDGISSNAVPRLANLMEDPGEGNYLLMHTSARYVPGVLRSRAATFRLGFLRDEHVEQICEGLGMAPKKVHAAVPLAAGSAERAVKTPSGSNATTVVYSLLSAVRKGDVEALTNVIAGVGEDEMQALRQWALEARTGRWRVFDEKSSAGLHKDTVLTERVLAMKGLRPRLAVRGALWRSCEKYAGRAAR